MIFQNAEIFNTSEVVIDEDGGAYFMRAPSRVANVMSDTGKMVNRGSTGVEIRFVLNSGEAKITMKTKSSGAIGRCTVFHGDFIADWPETNKNITDSYSEITIKPCINIDIARRVAKEYNHRFAPDVVRICFTSSFKILKIEGDISVPTPELLPSKKYLAYGSSITHGSNSIERPYEYPWRVGELLGADVQNLGFAGSARLEDEMADFIANDCEFDFATFEMGINILDIDGEEYERRVVNFLTKISNAHKNSKIFAIDVFYCLSDIVKDGRAEKFRGILRSVTERLSLPNVVYINGLDILPDAKYLSNGFVHPGPRAFEVMSENLIKIIRQYVH